MSVNGDMALINRRIRVLPSPHASSHELGGDDQVNLDASQIVSGTLAEDRIPHTLSNALTINNDLIANRLKLLLDSILSSDGVERIKFDTANNKVIIPCQLNVQGDLTVVDTTNMSVSDNIITLNAGESGDGVSLGSAGIEIDRGTLSNAQILFDETNDKFIFKLADGTYMPVDIASLQIGGTTIVGSDKKIYVSGDANNIIEFDGTYLKISSPNQIWLYGSGAASKVIMYAPEIVLGHWLKKETITLQREFQPDTTNTTSPSNPLRFQYAYYDSGTGNVVEKHIYIKSVATDTAGSGKLSILADDETTELMSVDTSGNVDVGSLSVGGTTIVDSNRDITCHFILVSNDIYGKIDLERTDVPQKWAIQIEPDGKFRIYDATNSKTMFQIMPNTGDINILNGGLQIGGTTVITNSRNLQNIVDITSSGKIVLDTLSFVQRIPNYDITALTFNAYYDGTNWNHPDTSKEAYLFYLNRGAGAFEFWFRDVPNNGDWLKIAQIDSSGNMNIAGSFSIGGTTVIDSSRNLKNVSIDRSTVNLPPVKVLEDRNEYYVSQPASVGSTVAEATNTYIDYDGTNIYAKVRLICEAYRKSFDGEIILEDDNGNTLASISVTASSWTKYDTGWVDLVANTEKLHVYIKATSDGSAEGYTYIRNIRIYVK